MYFRKDTNIYKIRWVTFWKRFMLKINYFLLIKHRFDHDHGYLKSYLFLLCTTIFLCVHSRVENVSSGKNLYNEKTMIAAWKISLLLILATLTVIIPVKSISKQYFQIINLILIVLRTHLEMRFQSTVTHIK